MLGGFITKKLGLLFQAWLSLWGAPLAHREDPLTWQFQLLLSGGRRMVRGLHLHLLFFKNLELKAINASDQRVCGVDVCWTLHTWCIWLRAMPSTEHTHTHTHTHTLRPLGTDGEVLLLLMTAGHGCFPTWSGSLAP